MRLLYRSMRDLLFHCRCRISNGFAFAEFRSIDETNIAAGQLNNVIIQGSQLRVGRPKKYEDNVPMEEQQRAIREGMEGGTAANQKSTQDITTCLQLSNMVQPHELADPEEVTAQCSNSSRGTLFCARVLYCVSRFDLLPGVFCVWVLRTGGGHP
jgi:hypothetical protein